MAGALGLENGFDFRGASPEPMENGGNLFAPDTDDGIDVPNITGKVVYFFLA